MASPEHRSNDDKEIAKRYLQKTTRWFRSGYSRTGGVNRISVPEST
ncbi:MAG: hypothetical protein WAO83_18280 [Fuerstiella sp.]